MNYAVDLIDRGDGDGDDGGEGEDANPAGGSTIGQVIEELEFMEMEICGPQSLEDMRIVLAKFLSGLEGHTEESLPPQDQEESEECGDNDRTGRRRNSLQSQLRDSEFHLAGVDLSAKTAARKKREELAALSKRGSSLKDRMKMYSDGGTLRGSWTNPDVDCDLGDDCDLEDLDKDAMNEQRQRRLSDVLNDVSLTEKEQTDRMKEVRAEFGVMEMKLRIRAASERAVRCQSAPDIGRDDDDVPSDGKAIIPRAERELKRGNRRSSIDLSAKSVAVKKAQELAFLKKQGSSVKDRMSQYTSQYDKADKEEEKTSMFQNEATENDKMRRAELLEIMQDKSLSREEKAKKMDEVKAKYAATTDETQGQEQHLEQQHRQELRSIMKDRSLSKGRRRKSIEIAKWKYSDQQQTSAKSLKDSNSDMSEGTIETAATTKASVTVDLSTKGYAERRRASLESLENSIGSNDEGKHVMSVRERLSMYQNNEFIAQA